MASLAIWPEPAAGGERVLQMSSCRRDRASHRVLVLGYGVRVGRREGGICCDRGTGEESLGTWQRPSGAGLSQVETPPAVLSAA